MEIIINFLQLSGGVILTIGYIPQIKQVIQTKSVKDLNVQFCLLTFIGILCMEIYAIDLALSGVGFMFFITNTISLILSGILFSLTRIYKKRSVCGNE